MELTDSEHDLFAQLAWFEPDPALPNMPGMRPYSLATRAALELLKRTIFNDDPGLDPDEERQQVALYIFLHSAPIVEVTGTLWDSSWSAAITPIAAALTSEDLAAFAEYRIRTLSAIAASQLAVRPRPARDDTPGDVIGPIDLCAKLTVISRNRGWSEERILWRTWLPKTLQIYYADRHWNGAWTIRVPRDTDPVDYEDTVPAWMAEETSGTHAFAPPSFDTPPPS